MSFTLIRECTSLSFLYFVELTFIANFAPRVSFLLDLISHQDKSMKKLKLAQVCLGGYSGYHISNTNLDEWLFNLAEQVELVYSPVADIKEYPEGVDIALVEGAIASEAHLKLIKQVRDRSKILVSFGDCAMDYKIKASDSLINTSESALQHSDLEIADLQNQTCSESEIIPILFDRVFPVEDVVEVDIYLPSCPPNVNYIRAAIEMVLMGEIPHLKGKLSQFD